MKTHLCTLFNYKYLDKGLVLFDSLKRVSDSFVLYVLAMDDQCYEVLKDQNEQALIPIKLSDFENERLLTAKSNRTFGEYCWTCSSSLIKYVLDTYNPECCTYIDADMYFYSDPQVLIDEMYSKQASVLVVGHRFLKPLEKAFIKESGRYCVEFNTFRNDENGRKLLDIWINQCIECCTHEYGKYCGDQKYLDNWCADFDFVVETENLGAGVAPWNISQYRLSGNDNGIEIKYKRTKKVYKLVFYHYERITYIDENTVNSNSYHYWGVDDDLVNITYRPYLYKIKEKKQELKAQYGIDFIMKHHPAGAPNTLNISDRIKNLIKRVSMEGGLPFLFYSRIPSSIFGKKSILHI